MAYDKLADGNRVYTAVSDNNISSADINELQDQLKEMLGPRPQAAMLSAGGYYRYAGGSVDAQPW